MADHLKRSWVLWEKKKLKQERNDTLKNYDVPSFWCHCSLCNMPAVVSKEKNTAQSSWHFASPTLKEKPLAIVLSLIVLQSNGILSLLIFATFSLPMPSNLHPRCTSTNKTTTDDFKFCLFWSFSLLLLQDQSAKVDQLSHYNTYSLFFFLFIFNFLTCLSVWSKYQPHSFKLTELWKFHKSLSGTYNSTGKLTHVQTNKQKCISQQIRTEKWKVWEANKRGM